MDKHMEGIENESSESPPSSCSSDTHDLFGDPEISPRVGEEYQVKIPPLMTKDELLQLMEDPVHLGLPVPVVWVLNQCESSKKEPANPDAAVHVPGLVDSESSEEGHTTLKSEDNKGKVKTMGSVLNDGEEIAKDSMDIDLVSPQEKTRNLDRGYEGCLPVPGLFGEAWKDIERDSFLLGLYIFGKNLSIVKKIIGTKGMGDILLYYHGKFYKSSEYKRWSECRKKRKKRVSYGEKIFTSWRQRELMSRLSTHVSEERKARLIKASRIFGEGKGEGKMSLEEYVLALKDMVGLELLVQAVAIGKGKRDLMSLQMEHAKTNSSFLSRSEIPSGKSGSSLTVDDIVNYLIGDIRLSKARANDLFWDAVWPRLLDNGWRVETPRNYVSLRSKQSWVYLIPGVKKFSRRKLVKGTHYFDSVTDVFNKVALEPKLLEHKPDTGKLGISKDEEGSGPHPQSEQGTYGFSSRECHSYLQPRVCQEQIKFTIVDTSLVCGKEKGKVIQLRTLPGDHVAISTPPVVSGRSKQNTIKESRNVAQENAIVNGTEDVMESKQSVDKPSCEASMALNNQSSNGSDRMFSATDKHEDQKQPRIPMKFKFSRKVKSSQSNDVGPTRNKPELTLCDNREKSGNGVNDTCIAVEKTEETTINLNLTHTLSEPNRDDEPLLKKLSEPVQQPEMVNLSGTVLNTDQNQVGNGQRQSRRNRPLTTKALEALACGYLSPKKKRKSGEAAKKTPRRVCAKTALLTSCGCSIGEEAGLQKMEKGVDGVFNGSSPMASTSQE